MQKLQHGISYVHLAGIDRGSIRAASTRDPEAYDKFGFFISNDIFKFLLRVLDFGFAAVASALIHLLAADLFRFSECDLFRRVFPNENAKVFPNSSNLFFSHMLSMAFWLLILFFFRFAPDCRFRIARF